MSDFRYDNRGFTLGVAVLGGLIAAFILGRAVANEDFAKIAAIISAVFASTLILGLGRRYWIAIPVALALNLPTFQVGARNVNLGELSIVICTVVFITRLALKRERLIVFTPYHTAFLCFVAWITLVFAIHPVGLAGLGSAVGGARFYAQIYLAFAALIIVSSQEITESDIKWVFGLIVVGTFLDLGRTLLEYLVLGRALGVAGLELETEGYYTWHQALSGPGMVVAIIMFSYWAPSKIFNMGQPWRGFVYFLCIPLIVLSGKRAAIAQLFALPVVSAILRKEYRFVVSFGLVMVLGLTFVVFGQGSIFSLPMAGQRALSWLPADWDPDLTSLRGGSDDFRQALRDIAWEEIQRDPWISDGFSVDIQETAGQYAMNQITGAPDIRDQVMGLALGKAWHNTWLGYSADFGIPLAIIQAFIFLTGIVLSYRLFRATRENTWVHMLAAYAFFFFLRDVAFSNTSGHTALDAFGRWWLYGMVIAAARQLLPSKRHGPLPKIGPAVHQGDGAPLAPLRSAVPSGGSAQSNSCPQNKINLQQQPSQGRPFRAN